MKLITKFWLRIICRYRQIIWHYTAIWIGTIRRQWINTSKWDQFQFHKKHCSDIMMSAMASQITGVSIVCLTVCWGAGKKKTKKKTSKLRVTGPREGNPPVTGGLFPPPADHWAPGMSTSLGPPFTLHFNDKNATHLDAELITRTPHPNIKGKAMRWLS